MDWDPLLQDRKTCWAIKKFKEITKTKFKDKNFLEFGYAHGFTNTILNKCFNFDKIISVDNISTEGQSRDSFANLRFKNIVLLCRLKIKIY